MTIAFAMNQYFLEWKKNILLFLFVLCLLSTNMSFTLQMGCLHQSVLFCGRESQDLARCQYLLPITRSKACNSGHPGKTRPYFQRSVSQHLKLHAKITSYSLNLSIIYNPIQHVHVYLFSVASFFCFIGKCIYTYKSLVMK